ncbi:MAG: patatin-like phospholipase family protein [Rhodobacteraceae bacterium]|nr:patatin-like phospholipase family protein [Paracoccaceae bacterium]
MNTPTQRKVGVALGAGAARGWAHIGVLQGLEELGVRPQVVAGCSSGALVGAAYVSGRLDRLADFASALSWSGMLRFFDISWRGGGLIEGRWLVDFFRKHVSDAPIESFGTPFGVVATELASGRETWMTRGSMAEAVRASIALPGLITPVKIADRWMVDGALVNPLPVSLCRSLGAEVILGVSMQGDLVRGRPVLGSLVAEADLTKRVAASESDGTEAVGNQSWLQWMAGASWTPAEARHAARVETPALAPPSGYPDRLGYLDVLGDSMFIVQNFISRVRLAADPVDCLIAPDVSGIGVMDFYRGAEAIAAGREAVLRSADDIIQLCGVNAPVPDVVATDGDAASPVA